MLEGQWARQEANLQAAVDQVGHIFIADDNAIDEMSADGATVTRIASGDGFRTVAIDPGTQDVIAGTINGGIYRIPQGGSATKIATDSGGQNYAGISVDPGGFIFTIGGSGCGGRIHRYSPDGSGETTLSSGLCFPSGIAVSAQDTIYYVANGQLNVNRFSVTTTSLPDATIGSAYGPVQLTAGPLGASTPPDVTTVKWKKGVVTVGKALPKGLHLSPTGVLSGTPSAKLAPGTYSVTVKATEKMIQVVAGHKVKTKVSATATIPIVIH